MHFSVFAESERFANEPRYRARRIAAAEWMSMMMRGRIVDIDGERGECLMPVAFEDYDVDCEMEEAA